MSRVDKTQQFELLEKMVMGGVAALGQELSRAMKREPLLVTEAGIEHYPSLQRGPHRDEVPYHQGTHGLRTALC